MDLNPAVDLSFLHERADKPELGEALAEAREAFEQYSAWLSQGASVREGLHDALLALELASGLEVS